MSIQESMLLHKLADDLAALTVRVRELETASGEEAMKRLWELESSQRNLKSTVTGRLNQWSAKINKLIEESEARNRENADSNG
jgi:hypothetical protein